MGVLSIILIINIIVEYIGDENFRKIILSGSIFQPFVASIIGLIPNCAASVILTQLYLENVIPAATMISGLLVGAGVGLIVLFKINKGIKQNLKITALLYTIGVVSGIIIQLIGIQF